MTVFLQVSFRSSNSRSEAKCARIIPVTKMILYYVSQSLYACEKTMLRVGNWADILVLHCIAEEARCISAPYEINHGIFSHRPTPAEVGVTRAQHDHNSAWITLSEPILLYVSDRKNSLYKHELAQKRLQSLAKFFILPPSPLSRPLRPPHLLSFISHQTNIFLVIYKSSALIEHQTQI